MLKVSYYLGLHKKSETIIISNKQYISKLVYCMRELGVYMIVRPRQEKKIFKTFSPVFERDIITECHTSFNMHGDLKASPAHHIRVSCF